ncbi:Uncharacterized protein HZ326_31304 [Fusarium oxysporum f. sp. albedinis]|nr:Uncharacterized protein HZ326_31304 [Fusarium oxysporum f. sp. albedinis]KAK2469659.1 hypothetical protein H9L39_18474 [Fusarium oxysporum f. sp. albedinis]
MQLSTAISVLSMALVAAASPEVYARGGKNTACCNGIANCLVFVGSNSCSGYSMKCKTNQKEVSDTTGGKSNPDFGKTLPISAYFGS